MEVWRTWKLIEAWSRQRKRRLSPLFLHWRGVTHSGPGVAVDHWSIRTRYSLMLGLRVYTIEFLDSRYLDVTYLHFRHCSTTKQKQLDQ